MPTQDTDEPAWTQDTSLSDDQRWRAFKTWEAARRVQFGQSNQAREEYAAWLATEPKPELGRVRPPVIQRPKVFRFS